MDELLYESPLLRRFVGVDLGIAPAPDQTTVLRFRHLLEQHDLCGMMLDAANQHLEAKGITIQSSTIVAHEQRGRARLGHVQDEEGQPVLLPAEGSRRRGRKDRHGACVGGDPCQRGKLDCPALRGAQGLGRRWLSGTVRSDSRRRSQRAGQDLPQNKVQVLSRRVTEKEESE